MTSAIGANPVRVPSVEISNPKTKSLLDPCIQLDDKRWAVTLVKHVKGKTHAKLFIEKVQENSYFLVEAEFTSDAMSVDPNCKTPKIIKKQGCLGFSYLFCNLGEVKSRLYTREIAENRIRYQYKTETFVRDAKEVQALLNKIALEESAQEVVPQGYSPLGKNSWFTHKDKIYKIEEDDAKDGEEGDIKRLFREYPRRFFLEMARAEKDETFLTKHRWACLLPAAAAAPFMAIPVLGALPAAEVQACLNKVRMGEPYESFPFTKKFLGLKTKANPEWYTNAVRKMKEDYKKYITLIEVKANNCETWAEEKLETVEVKIPHDWKDNIMSTVDKHATIPNPDPERAKPPPKPKKTGGGCGGC